MISHAHELVMVNQDLSMLRLVEQARHLTFAVAQHYQTREVMLLAPDGKVFMHNDISVLREWLRHYAHCGTFGRRCFVDGCQCVSAVPGLKREG